MGWVVVNAVSSTLDREASGAKIPRSLERLVAAKIRRLVATAPVDHIERHGFRFDRRLTAVGLACRSNDCKVSHQYTE
jgi:hypothetical protein